MRRQFVLDRNTNQILNQLAADHAGNHSHVVRQAIQLFADMEARLDAIEADPSFQAMADRSDADFRQKRFVSHAEVKRRMQALRKRRKK